MSGLSSRLGEAINKRGSSTHGGCVSGIGEAGRLCDCSVVGQFSAAPGEACAVQTRFFKAVSESWVALFIRVQSQRVPLPCRQMCTHIPAMVQLITQPEFLEVYGTLNVFSDHLSYSELLFLQSSHACQLREYFLIAHHLDDGTVVIAFNVHREGSLLHHLYRSSNETWSVLEKCACGFQQWVMPPVV